MEAPMVLIPEAELLTAVIKEKRRVSLMKAQLLVVLEEVIMPMQVAQESLSFVMFTHDFR